MFGFPNARRLIGSVKFAIQDQHMAFEWIAESVKEIGSNPEKITLWAQSAGANLTDMCLFVWPTDPVIRASVSRSGVAVNRTIARAYETSNFTFIAKALGCNFADPALELHCIRRVPMPRVENFIGK